MVLSAPIEHQCGGERAGSVRPVVAGWSHQDAGKVHRGDHGHHTHPPDAPGAHRETSNCR